MAGASEPQASAFSAAELEFLAEDEMIEIVPNLRMDPLNFISVRSLIEDIKDVRFHKIGTGLEIISRERTYALRLKNLSAMEANIVRPFVTRALETFYKLSSSEMIQESDHIPNRQPQATNRGPRVLLISK
ncbi:UNVERIFIED_CONTAM: DNA replication complex GINS protein PSF2 [Sesamum radiatum]|uniref:DNA replication complex GINS protein PSF2 n=1 Tax=Sesamum radiatum TaxID=300843 RepID=A0AAW2S6P0_SESRA